MDAQLAVAQALRYADELRQLHAAESAHRRATEDALARLERSYVATVRALATTLELRDDQTGGHAERVTGLALRLTEAVAPELLDEPQLEYGFLLHDVGKIGVRDAVLLKPGPLDDDELAEMRLHTQLGERVLEGIPFLGGVAKEVVACHHEAWDGSGYPKGLRGEDVPLAARVFAVVDAFDAMTNDRPYRRALSVDAALEEIERCAETQFDPRLARAFVSLDRQRRSAA